jgi:hypothetical protein
MDVWIFTETGFVSAVRKHEAPTEVTARARDRQSLEDLAALAEREIQRTDMADYRYRVVVPDAVFKAWLATSVDMLDYDNFKNRVWDSRGDTFHTALNQVWGAMLSVDDAR